MASTTAPAMATATDAAVPARRDETAVPLTDEELDADWVPSGRRPQSTIARSFSQELMDIFRIENSVADLDEKVNKQKQQINTQASELEALQARIREMEDRLRRSNNDPVAPAGSRSAQPLPDNKAARANQTAPGSGAMPPTPSASEDGHE